jgi:hypothetical protein
MFKVTELWSGAPARADANTGEAMPASNTQIHHLTAAKDGTASPRPQCVADRLNKKRRRLSAPPPTPHGIRG